MGLLDRLLGRRRVEPDRGGTRAPFIRASFVVAATLDPRWPAVPPRYKPPTLTTAMRNELPFVTSSCPTCGADVNPLPKGRKRCKGCGVEMYVIVVDQRQRALVTAAQHQALGAAEAALEAAAYVVGESHYMTELSGLMAALRTDPDDRDAMAVALLRREPANRYDRNAVRVEIHGKLVGHLDRDAAADIQAWLKRLERDRRPAFVLARIGGGRVTDGRVGPIGVVLEDLPAVFDR